MNGYIDKLIMKYGNPQTRKPQFLRHQHREVTHGAKEELTLEEDTGPPLDNKDTKSIQGILGVLLYYAIAVDNKLLVILSAIGT